MQIWGSCPDYIIIPNKNINLKKKRLRKLLLFEEQQAKCTCVFQERQGFTILRLFTMSCILFFKSYYANDPSL